jgi:uncharacterized protein (TIGR02246 family)
MTEELLDLERRAWEALATAGGARPFYEEVLAPDVAMVLPGDLVLDGRDAVLSAMEGQPWDSFDLEPMRVLPLGAGAAAVIYRARARRGGVPYRARFTSVYLQHDGRWRLALHQQTPIEDD